MSGASQDVPRARIRFLVLEEVILEGRGGTCERRKTYNFNRKNWSADVNGSCSSPLDYKVVQDAYLSVNILQRSAMMDATTSSWKVCTVYSAASGIGRVLPFEEQTFFWLVCCATAVSSQRHFHSTEEMICSSELREPNFNPNTGRKSALSLRRPPRAGRAARMTSRSSRKNETTYVSRYEAL